MMSYYLALVFYPTLVILLLDRMTDGCTEPQIEESCINNGRSHESFLMLQPTYSYNGIQHYINIHRFPRDREHRLRRCAWQEGNAYNSTCPHHWVLNLDRNRKPERLLEAKCNCNAHMPCLDGISGSRCVPVKYYIYVLRKNGCNGTHYEYVQTVEPITVGCTCSYPAQTG